MPRKPAPYRSISLALPEPLRTFVAERSRERHASARAYVLDLIREDQQRFEQSLNGKLLEGLDSGEPIEVTPDYWASKHKRLVARSRRRKLG